MLNRHINYICSDYFMLVFMNCDSRWVYLVVSLLVRECWPRCAVKSQNSASFSCSVIFLCTETLSSKEKR